MSRQNNIAIDGHSSCGKGTLAKYLAKELGMHTLDTGAMYRAVTYGIKDQNISLKDTDAIKTFLKASWLNMQMKDGKLSIRYKGEDISSEIRLPGISNLVSQVSEIKEIRDYLVDQQQEIAKNGGIVMDGRDIGTHVLPNAALKIFMTADPKIRAERRFNELKAKSVNVSFQQVYENILFRDKTDSSRKINPLLQAEDAKVLDNSNIDIQKQNEIALNWAKEMLAPSS